MTQNLNNGEYEEKRQCHKGFMILEYISLLLFKADSWQFLIEDP